MVSENKFLSFDSIMCDIPHFHQVWYHAHCADGAAAAMVAYRASRSWKITPSFFSVQYGHPHPPVKEGHSILVVDFSYPAETWKRIRKHGVEVVCIDHHASAEDSVMSLPPSRRLFSLDYSGAVLTWKFFHPLSNPPRLLRYVQDRDLWEFRLPNSAEINEVIATDYRSSSLNMSLWSDLLDSMQDKLFVNDMVQRGSVLLSAKDKLVDHACSKAKLLYLAGQPCMAVNSTVYFSEIAHRLAERFSDCAAGATYFFRNDGLVQFSLRSVPGVSCLDIATHYGGGGHPQACGFELTLDKFVELISE